MHPTFDILRQQTAENRFIKSTANSMNVLTKTGKELVSPEDALAITQLYISKHTERC